MNMNLSPSEIQVIKIALVDYKLSQVDQGAHSWTLDQGRQFAAVSALLITIAEKEAKEWYKEANRSTKVIPNKRWMFNFTTGGWNTVYAKTKRGAIAKAAKEYKNTNLIPNPKTFAVATDDAMKNALSSFY